MGGRRRLEGGGDKGSAFPIAHSRFGEQGVLDERFGLWSQADDFGTCTAWRLYVKVSRDIGPFAVTRHALLAQRVRHERVASQSPTDLQQGLDGVAAL